MRKVLIAMFAAGGLGLFGTAASFGLPVNGNIIADAASENSIVQNVRRCTYRGRVYHVPGACGGKCVTQTWRREGRQWIRWHYC